VASTLGNPVVRFCFHQKYSHDELAPDRLDPWWDDWWKISEAMLHTQTLRKFNYNESNILELIQPFEKATREYGFPDTYTWNRGEEKFIPNCWKNYIMNASPWLCIMINPVTSEDEINIRDT
jgi:hypothetical protein